MVQMLALSGLLIFVLCSTVVVSSVSFGVVQASTTVNSQIITSDSTCTKADSPYTFRGPVAVDEGVTLPIQPGATVDMNNNY